MDWITGTFLLCIGFFIGRAYYAYKLSEMLKTDPEQMINLLKEIQTRQKEQKNNDVREMTIEKENDVFYFYDKDTHEFLSQGNTIDQALEKLIERYPGVDFISYVQEDDANRMGLISKDEGVVK